MTYCNYQKKYYLSEELRKTLTKKAMTYHEIKFTKNPDFKDLFAWAKVYYIQYDLSANGCYNIVPELQGNGKINTVWLGKGCVN